MRFPIQRLHLAQLRHVVKRGHLNTVRSGVPYIHRPLAAVSENNIRRVNPQPLNKLRFSLACTVEACTQSLEDSKETNVGVALNRVVRTYAREGSFPGLWGWTGLSGVDARVAWRCVRCAWVRWGFKLYGGLRGAGTLSGICARVRGTCVCWRSAVLDCTL